jgi:single-strand DNA-binding protein
MSDTITIVGTVGTDPDHKRAVGDLPITNFRLASSQRRFDAGANAWVETATNWYKVSAFRGLAEHAFQSLRKGDRVIVTGRLRVREWESGEKKGTAIEIDADAIGHDLLWGTTTYRRDASSAASSARANDGWAPVDSDSSEWAPADEPTAPAGTADAGEYPQEDAAEDQATAVLAGAASPF